MNECCYLFCYHFTLPTSIFPFFYPIYCFLGLWKLPFLTNILSLFIFHNTFPLSGILSQYFCVTIFCFMYIIQLLVQARTWGNFWGSFQVSEKWGLLHFYFLTSTHKFYWLTAYLYSLLFSNCLLTVLSNKLFYNPGTSSLPGAFPIYLFSAYPRTVLSAHSMFPFSSLQSIFWSYSK